MKKILAPIEEVCDPVSTIYGVINAHMKFTNQFEAAHIAVHFDLIPSGYNSADMTHTTPPQVAENEAINKHINAIITLFATTEFVEQPTIAIMKFDVVIRMPPIIKTLRLPIVSTRNSPGILKATLTAYVMKETK